LEIFLLSLPFVGMACVIDRQGYVTRYRERHHRLWYICKMAFCVLAERAAKFADDNGRKLEIFFERSGNKEDRSIIQYMRELEREGNPFNQQTSGVYTPLSAEDYHRNILGEPRWKTKEVAMIQIADLVLYPMAKGGYDSSYNPYRKLKESGKLIDCLLTEDQILVGGNQYSCFDTQKD
jgi:hypothetical protein